MKRATNSLRSSMLLCAAWALCPVLVSAASSSDEKATLAPEPSQHTPDLRPPTPTGRPPVELERGREQLHPGEPLDLKGADSAEDSFRNRVPALMSAGNVGAQVDLDALRRSRLSLYSSPAGRTELPPEVELAALQIAGVTEASADQAANEEPAAEQGESSSALTMLLCVVTLAGSLVAFMRVRMS